MQAGKGFSVICKRGKGIAMICKRVRGGFVMICNQEDVEALTLASKACDGQMTYCNLLAEMSAMPPLLNTSQRDAQALLWDLEKGRRF